MNVSKELLNEVLGEQVHEIQILKNKAIFGGIQLWIYSESHDVAVNIHELAHKCKEWIKSTSHYELVIYDSNVYLTTCGLGGEGGFYYDYKFIADTEPEAVFKACQWVLD